MVNRRLEKASNGKAILVVLKAGFFCRENRTKPSAYSMAHWLTGWGSLGRLHTYVCTFRLETVIFVEWKLGPKVLL